MASQQYDVIIVGAGLSGICAAYYLQKHCPDKTWTILEARDSMGGTWDLFRYPGIRSDSDMFSFGFQFRPWTSSKALGDGGTILQYIKDTAAEFGIDQKIEYGRRVNKADWDSQSATWTLTVQTNGRKRATKVSARFVISACGYYRYDQGYTPDFAGLEDFQGTVVHPQLWPEDLDYHGKEVVLIGSGATAMTLVPALADDVGHITMLQRSPTYVISMPEREYLVDLLKVLPPEVRAPIVRWKNILTGQLFYQVSQRHPRLVKKLLRKQMQAMLRDDFDIDMHFTPHYDPWDQRLCLVPDGDLYRALNSGKADIVTDHIARFDASGIVLQSGRHLPADIVITATGLTLQPIGGIQLSLDGEEVQLPEHMGYRGVMLSDIPNFASIMGYTNASWTLKADLSCDYLGRLLRHMDARGFAWAKPVNTDPSIAMEDGLDLQAGYIQRALAIMPKQGSGAPWKVYQNYMLDYLSLKFAPIADGVLRFGTL